MDKTSFQQKKSTKTHNNGITKDKFIKIILKWAILPTEALWDDESDESEDETIPKI